MKLPVAWTIAGSDPSGCAGIQADLKTFQQLDVHGCSVITAITAQNTAELSQLFFLPEKIIQGQIQTLQKNLWPKAIKIGMLGKNDLENFLIHYDGLIVLDPLIYSTSGKELFSGSEKKHLQNLEKLFPLVDLVTPNIPEAEKLLGKELKNFADIEQAASDLLARGAKSVLLKGGHSHDNFSQDYWTNGKEAFWLSTERQAQKSIRGTGCILSSAITACLASGYELKDALVIGKMYVNQCIRSGDKGWPENQYDLPYLSTEPLQSEPKKFPDCGTEPLGLYPVIDNSSWLEKLLPLGIRTIQLRIKNKTGYELESEIKRSVELAKKYNARLFINDYWELAIQHNAYGVHLGQEDLLQADISALQKNNLRLGISTHCYYEVARAHALAPSYIAYGPIFPTTSKIMPFAPQGIENLKRWRRMLNYPLVAIGGIDLEKIPALLETRVNGIALISAITQAVDPKQSARELLAAISRCIA